MARRCAGSWLDSYIEYTHNQESPTAFHEWTALSLIGASLSRHVWIPRIKYTIFPNLFVILVAGSAVCRKSVAINIGLDLLRALKNPPMVFAQKITTEALIQALEVAKIEGSSSGLICATELSTFMGSDGIRSGIIPTLTDLYDSPKEWVYHTRGRGKEVLKNVTVAILAATTRDWLKTSIPPESVGGGFTSRIIFVCQERASKPILFPNPTVDEGVLRSNLVADLNEIQTKVKGPMDFTPEAKEYAEKWYATEFTKIRDSKLDGYFARKHDTMFKLAAILSIAESSNRVITHAHIEKSLNVLEENEEHLGEIIASVVATAVGGDTEKVLTTIKKCPMIMHSDLLRKCWRFATAEGVSQMLRTLIEAREVEEVLGKDNRTRFYKVKRR